MLSSSSTKNMNKSTRILLIFGVAILFCCVIVKGQVDCGASQTLDFASDSLNLHFFLDISNKLSSSCTKIDAKYGMMRLEAFRYALSLVNSNQTLLKGKELGAVVYDTCKNPNRELICSVGDASLVGIVGPENSETAQIASVIYTSFVPKVSLVSYGATSEYLNEKQEYSNLFHTIPSDDSAYDALTDIALFFNWTYIGVLHSHNTLGDGLATFRKMSSRKGLCIKFSGATKKVMSNDYLFNLLKPLRMDPKLEVVFLLLADNETKTLLDYLERNHNSYKHINFIGGQKLGTKIDFFSGNKSLGMGVLTIEVESPKVPDFERYYLNLRPENNTRNTYFKKFWEETFNCSIDKVAGKAPCSGKEKLKKGNGFYENASIIPIINAVLAFGNAIGEAITERCAALTGPNKTACLASNITVDTLQTEPYLTDSVTKNLPSVQFSEPTEAKAIFKFDKNYRRKTNYVIYNTQLIENEILHQHVGLWKNKNSTLGPRDGFREKLTINTSLIKWRNNKMPLGRCSNECAKNQHKIFNRYLSCCWDCKTCSTNAIIVNNSCKACQHGTWPDMLLKNCNKMAEIGVSAKDNFSIVIIIFAVISICVTLLVILIYLKNYERRAIKATNRELSLVVLFGIIVVFITALVFLAHPTSLVCNIQQCLFGAGFVLCAAPLFLKTMTLYRIVQRAATTIARPKLSKCRSQLLICLGLVCIEFLFAALWVQGNAAKVENYIPTGKIQVVTHCQFNSFGLIINFAYPGILMMLAMIFAMRTRNMKIPPEVNEARHIAAAMALSCFILFIYLISFPVYSRSKENFTQEYSISIAYFLVGTVNLCSIFIPRVIYVYRPAQESGDRSRASTIVSPDVYSTAESTPVQVLRRNKMATSKVSPLSINAPLGIINRTASVSP